MGASVEGHPDHQGDISRRDFVRVSAVAAGTAVLGCSDSITVVTDPTAQVAIVRGTSFPEMASDVLGLLGGIETVVHPGETVFIKPNFVSLPGVPNHDPFGTGECTKPELVVALARQCLEAGASEVTIGDGSHALQLDWDRAMMLDRSNSLADEVARLAADYDRPVRLASLESDSPRWTEVPSTTYLGSIAVSSLVVEADRVISVPVAKTHSWAQLTLSLKNFIGIASLERYGDLPRGVFDRGVVFDHSSPAAIAAIYLDIVQGVEPDLAIIDFSLGVEGNGPNLSHGGRTVDMRQRLGSYLLVASTDLVAADATAARIMRHDPDDIDQLVMGYQMGLGEMRDTRIEILGEQVHDVDVSWARASLRGMQALAQGGCPGRSCPGGAIYGP